MRRGYDMDDFLPDLKWMMRSCTTPVHIYPKGANSLWVCIDRLVYNSSSTIGKNINKEMK